VIFENENLGVYGISQFTQVKLLWVFSKLSHQQSYETVWECATLFLQRAI